jgi:hypothetical protein
MRNDFSEFMRTSPQRCPYCGHEPGMSDDVCKHCGKIFWSECIGPLIFLPLVSVVCRLCIPGVQKWVCNAIGVLSLCVSLVWFLMLVTESWRIRGGFRGGCESAVPRHRWTGWKYERDGSCVQARHCRRCGESQRRQKHSEWTNWEYKGASSCVQVRVCRRCGKNERRAKHREEDWTGWHYVADHRCDQVRVCRHGCGAEEKRVKHNWEPEYYFWDYDHEYCWICARCGERG